MPFNYEGWQKAVLEALAKVAEVEDAKKRLVDICKKSGQSVRGELWQVDKETGGIVLHYPASWTGINAVSGGTVMLNIADVDQASFLEPVPELPETEEEKLGEPENGIHASEQVAGEEDERGPSTLESGWLDADVAATSSSKAEESIPEETWPEGGGR